MKHLFLILACAFFVSNTLVAQNVKGDFNLLDIWGGLPVSVSSSWFDGKTSVDTFKNGIWIKHGDEPVKITRDALGRIQSAQGLVYEYDKNDVVSSLYSNTSGNVQTMDNWNKFNIGAVNGSSKWEYILTKFNSHGDWIEREAIVTSNMLKKEYKQTREIVYTDTKPDNSLTVLDESLSPLVGCVLFVCDSRGKKLDFIRGFVSDMDGKFYNLPYSEDITYRLQYVGYDDSVVSANPNAVVVLK